MIKRYDVLMERATHWNPRAVMIAAPEGEYVKWEDVKKLLIKIEEQRAELNFNAETF